MQVNKAAVGHVRGGRTPVTSYQQGDLDRNGNLQPAGQTFGMATFPGNRPVICTGMADR